MCDRIQPNVLVLTETHKYRYLLKGYHKETKLVLNDPQAVRLLFATKCRLRATLKTEVLELPFYRETPLMSPNVERYGITVAHAPGVPD